MNYKIYEVEYDGGDLYGVSLVDTPANGFEFIALKEELKKVEFKADKKKQIVFGIVLRPEQKIYREMEDGTPYFLKFSADTIEKFSHDFINKGYQHNSTYNHDIGLKDVSVVEQWIVEDKDRDKASVIGLSVEKGDWIIGMKLSGDVWKDYVESGKVKGFSIDSLVKLKEVKLKEVELIKNKNKKMSIVDKFIKMLSSVKMATIETEAGELTADEFSEGNVVWDSNMEPFVGEFIYDDKVFQTDANGVIVYVADVESTELEKEDKEDEKLEEVSKEDEKEEDEVKEEEKEEEKLEVEKEEVEEVVDVVEEIVEEAEAGEDVTKQIDELKDIISGLKEEVEALKSKHADTKLKANARTKASPIKMKTIDRSNMSPLEVFEKLRNNKK